MKVALLIIGKEILSDKSFDFNKFFIILSDKGYEVSDTYIADDVIGVKSTLKSISQPILLVVGDTDAIYDCVDAENDIKGKLYFKHDDSYYILLPSYDEQYIKDIVIPILNNRSKTFYNTIIFKVFGKTEHEIKEIISEHLHNRNKIEFNFYPSILECAVHIRYSNHVSGVAANDTIDKIGGLLRPYSYSFGDVSLPSQVASQIARAGKKISIAETFTSGGVMRTLCEAGNSNSLLLESIVANSESSFKLRLGLDDKTIASHGLISDEAAYIVAGNLFVNSDTDIALAVIGNTAKLKGNQEEADCVYYIAIGDKDEIHVFAEHYFGNEQEIIEAGIKHALYILHKFIR